MSSSKVYLIHFPLNAPQHALASVTLHRKETLSSPFLVSHRSRPSPRTGTCRQKSPERTSLTFVLEKIMQRTSPLSPGDPVRQNVLRHHVRHPYLSPRRLGQRHWRERERVATHIGRHDCREQQRSARERYSYEVQTKRQLLSILALPTTMQKIL